MSNKISKNRQKKEQIVAKLSEKIKKANALVFANYQGMTHQQMEELKKALKAVNAELVVAKNSLLNLALKNSEAKPAENQLKEPTATLFAYSDPIAAVKELFKTIKKINLPIVKFGILEKKILTGEDVNRLSTIPPREVLIAQLVGGMKSPIYGLHRALNWNLQKLVMTLKAIESKKS